MPAKIIFVTGTDTGVGKTVFTGLMLDYLRSRKVHALALKPFCSGRRADARVLESLQNGELCLDEVNPYWFSEPLAPMMAARKENRSIAFQEVCGAIGKAAARCDCLLVEGAGGLLVPLGNAYTLLDLISVFSGFVVVVGRNRLGTLNHTLLTVRALNDWLERNPGTEPRCRYAVALMNERRPDRSARTNIKALAELTGQVFVTGLPHLGTHPVSVEHVIQNRKKVRKTLVRILQISSLGALFFAT